MLTCGTGATLSLNDSIITGHTCEGHAQNLEEVLRRFQTAVIRIQKFKV